MCAEPFFERTILRREELDPESYPLSVPAVAEIESVRFSPGMTVLAGENGSGKSTLIEAIAVAAGFNAEGSTKNLRTDTTPQDGSLADALTLVRNPGRETGGYFLRAESGYMTATYLNQIGMSSAYGGNLHNRSHGESLTDIFRHHFENARNALFILDEIESGLSTQRQLEFLGLIHRHLGRGSSFLISTHSPILMSYPGSRLYWLDADGIAERDGRETEHAVLLRTYLERPERIQRALFE